MKRIQQSKSKSKSKSKRAGSSSFPATIERTFELAPSYPLKLVVLTWDGTQTFTIDPPLSPAEADASQNQGADFFGKTQPPGQFILAINSAHTLMAGGATLVLDPAHLAPEPEQLIRYKQIKWNEFHLYGWQPPTPVPLAPLGTSSVIVGGRKGSAGPGPLIPLTGALQNGSPDWVYGDLDSDGGILAFLVYNQDPDYILGVWATFGGKWRDRTKQLFYATAKWGDINNGGILPPDPPG